MATIDVMIPVLNEERALPGCIEQLGGFLRRSMQHHTNRIVIVDNGSTDRTLGVCQELAASFPKQVSYVHLDERGRGRALRRAWLESDADIVSYMDVDLSTALDSFPSMINGILDDGVHIAFGSRLAAGAKTKRSTKREFVSRAYNRIIRVTMGTSFKDAQCGFKALSRSAAQVLVPKVINNHWFFDTELLVIAEKRGFKMLEVPVEWNEDKDTRVKIIQTALEDLRGLARLRIGGVPNVTLPVDVRE